MSPPRSIDGPGPIAVTGGIGFIGSNLAHSLLADGADVLIVDNLSRPGVEANLEWLREIGGPRLHFVRGDVRDAPAMDAVLADCRAVFHFAAQTAVTTSLLDPREDFEVNGRGTLNVLEAVRKAGRSAPVIFSSTNKVYGSLEDLEMTEADDRYVPADEAVRQRGIGEARPLAFCTPYGCSKGLADQYVLDYAKSFGIPTAVLRMSCIYGPRQFGTEDQGWVAHFLIRALAGEEIVVYGDGKQVRDILYVDDAVAAYRALLANIGRVSGRAFNLGGGPRNAVSLRMVLGEAESLVGHDIAIAEAAWRPGDQLYFVADTTALSQTLGWRAGTAWRTGLAELLGWLQGRRQAQAPARRAIA
jgi:CDP-paratose 2-epimerase